MVELQRFEFEHRHAERILLAIIGPRSNRILSSLFLAVAFGWVFAIFTHAIAWLPDSPTIRMPPTSSILSIRISGTTCWDRPLRS